MCSEDEKNSFQSRLVRVSGLRKWTDEEVSAAFVFVKSKLSQEEWQEFVRQVSTVLSSQCGASAAVVQEATMYLF